MDLSIVIPAYNEEERIGDTLDAYLDHFKDESFEIIVVIEGTDKTLDIVKEYSKKCPVRYSYSEKRLGKGGAILEGFKIAKGSHIGFTDADAATSPEEFERIWKGCEGFDGAIGSRWIAGSERQDFSLKRKILSRGYNFGVRLYLGLPYKDTQCGAKVFSKKVIDELASKVKILDYSFDAAFLFLANKYGFKFNEVPVAWRADEEKSTMFLPRETILMGWSVIKSRFKK